MFKHLEKLRALPEGKRKIIVLAYSSGITAVILLSWLVFPTSHFGSLVDEDKERKSAENLVAPFSAIGGEIEQATGGLKEKWDSFGGSAGILSAISAIKGNAPGSATTTDTSATTSTDVSTLEEAQKQESFSAQEAFMGESGPISSSVPEESTTTDGNKGLSFGEPQGQSFVATTTATTTIQ
jgi:hypothetical protein